MPKHITLFLVFSVALLLVAACENDAPTSPYVGYLEEEIPLCTPVPDFTVDPCEPDAEVETHVLTSPGASAFFSQNAPRTIRDHLDGGVLGYIPHLVLRGTFLPDTVRCESGVPNRDAPYEESGGYFKHSILIQCYADVRVNEYILGTGSPRLPVLVTYWHYWHGYYAGGLPSAGLETEEGYVEALRALYVSELEEGPRLDEGPKPRGKGIYGREMILFVGPAHNRTTEVLELFRTWDVQRQEDGTVIAVHPERDQWRIARPDDYQTHRSALEMELPSFKQAVTIANQARVTEYGGRIAPEDISGRAEGVALPMLIADTNGLRQFYRDTGAYNHPDGPPVQPPPPCGLVVSNQTENPGLMPDCFALLAAKDTLRGTATLNWGLDTLITSWDGVTVEGTPKRVTKLLLTNKGLSGSIPEELGQLSGLEEIRLSGNSLTGCIPIALQSVATNDLSALNLLYCRPPVPTASPPRK